jgi:sugar phosphate permease
MEKTSLRRKEFEPEIQERHPSITSVKSSTAWIIWACAGAFYLYEMILRVSPSVMTQGLMHDFGVTSTALGVLASFYYYAYVALQVPCGVIVDWLGTRKVVTASAALCTVGSIIFAECDSLYMAQMGRFLIGAGSACAFLSCLKVAAEWFSPAKFALISGLTNMMGTLGGTFGGRPFAMMVNHFGWRTATLIAAGAGIVMTLMAWLIIRDRPYQAHPDELEHELSLKDSLKILATNPQTWLIAAFGGLMYVPISAFTELWAVPYLMQTYGIDNELASTASVMLFIGMAVGSPIAAWLSDFRKSRLDTMRWSALGTLGIFLMIVFVPGIPLGVMFLLLFTAGMLNGGQVLCFACVKEVSPHQISGTTVGFTNAVVMMSGVIFQPLLGMLLDYAWDGQLSPDGIRIYSDAAYQMAIMAVPICLGLSWLLLKFARETYGRHVDFKKGDVLNLKSA